MSCIQIHSISPLAKIFFSKFHLFHSYWTNFAFLKVDITQPNMDAPCKGCSNCFKSILKHISHSKTCKKFYSSDEMSALRDKSTARKYAKRRKSYDPSKRAKMLGDKLNKKNEEKTTPHKRQPAAETEIIECIGCNFSFKKEHILKHIVKSAKCSKIYYSPSLKSELDNIRTISKIRSNKKNKECYQNIKQTVAEDYSVNMLIKEQMKEGSENLRIQCKSCKRSFEKKEILRHMAKSIMCNSFYSMPSSKQELKRLKRMGSNASKKQRQKKRAEDYSFNMLAKELANEQHTNNLIECKACERNFEENDILRHISKSVMCNNLYSKAPLKEELKTMKRNYAKLSRQKRLEKRVEEYKQEREEERLLRRREDLLRTRVNLGELLKELEERANLSKIAQDLVKNVNIDYESLQKAKSSIRNLYMDYHQMIASTLSHVIGMTQG